ncbi:ABC transporter ATP-binding protein [Neoroseomonas soli]|uniref:ABC transporter ATP-binding protein n=1 Tax=Neoroseomonas soli TaxID=1081025 RepID=A0A9X9WTH5_9PROT|nr:ABC transporter ATP-binding protein [Neoroseomonas soli]MBR0670454.1 ABC transporter ATP-binding protein [Neoroseomonas soli]
MAETLLEARGLGVRFGDFRALSEVVLDVAAGSLHAVIGPNGAGKTTLFNVLTGRIAPSEGRIVLAGRDVTRLPAHRRVHLGMARSFQVTNIFADLTVAENLRLAVQAVSGAEPWVFWRARTPSREKVAALLDEAGLAARADWRAGDLSHGGQRALEIGMALAADPRIIFLDEPLAGMGIDDIHRTKEMIHDLVPARTVVLIEHNMRVVLDISDRITVLAQGRPIAEGAPAMIRSDAAVREAYLGSGM